MNRRDGAEEELCSGRIRTGDLRVIQRAGFGGLQRGERGVVGNDNVRVIAEALNAAIPNVAVNVVIWPRGLQQERKMPHGRKHEPDDDYAAREFLREEELTNGKEVRDAGNEERDDERGRTDAAGAARADDLRHKQDRAEHAQPAGWREIHRLSAAERNCAADRSHLSSQADVRGARWGASRSSAERRVKSPSTSTS